MFLQETQSDVSSEVDWCLRWVGEYFLSHGTSLNIKIIAVDEVESRCLLLL